MMQTGLTREQVQAFRVQLRSNSAEAVEKLPEELAALRNAANQVDPLRLVGAVDVFDAMRRSALPGHASFGSDAMVELLAGVVASLEETEVLRRIDEPFDPSVVWETDARLRRIANMQSLADLRALDHVTSADRVGLTGMLHMENRFDRMAGFDSQVRRVNLEIFGRVDEACWQKLGFRLTDSLRFAHLYNQVRLLQADSANEIMDSFPPLQQGASEEDQMQWMARHMIMYAVHACAPVEGCSELEDHLAEQMGLSANELQRLIAAMGTRLGTVDPDQVTFDNPLRHSPLLTLSTGEWVWARPVDFLHGSLEWAAHVCSADENLLRKFDKARQQVAEQLPATILASVFGEDRVHAGVTYPVEESDAEVDVLVSLPGATLIVECKGGRVSREGRRGAPRRVERHIQDIVERANTQNARTAQALKDGTEFRTSAKHSLGVERDATPFPITVTLERVDPFSAFLGASEEASGDEQSWILNLADLILLADVLESPSDFMAYVEVRRRMLNSRTRILVEADALGSWCEDRLTRLDRLPDPSTGAWIDVVSRTSEWMNDYYTVEALTGMEVDEEEVASYASKSRGSVKPHTQLPSACLAALDRALAAGAPDWVALCRATLAVQPRSWKAPGRTWAVNAEANPRTTRNVAKKVRRARAGVTVDNSVVVRLTSEHGAPTEVELKLPPDRI